MPYTFWRILNYAKNSEANGINHQLNAAANLEAIENFSTSTRRHGYHNKIRLPFGQQAVDNTTITSNRTSIFDYSISPYIKGFLGPDTSYLLRHNTYGVDTTTGSGSANTGIGTISAAQPTRR
jgi:uncharacterized protein (PEP-CTERM system associated)